MEEDDFEVLPGSTCVVGFLRTYASFLRLDADSLVEAYKREYGPRIEEPAPVVRTEVTTSSRSRTSAERRQKRVRRQHRSYAVAGFFAIVAVALLAWFGTGRSEPPASLGANNITSSTLTTTASLTTGSTNTMATVAGDDATSSTGGAGSSTTVAGSGGKTTSTTKAGSKATTTTATAESEPGSEGAVQLVLSVNEGSCWLVVREDGENGAEIFAGTLSAGGKQTFDTAKQYWLMAGNPEALSVLVGGNPYTLEAPAGSFVVTGAGIERAQ